MHPILLATPWFNVYTYGLLIAAGYTLGTMWILKEAQKDGLNVEAIFDMMIMTLVVGICGSRLLFILEYTPDKLTFSDFFSFEQGGLTFYGAVISGTLFDLLFLRYKRIPFWRAMDTVGFGLPLGIAVARLGCFFNGCCYGIACSYPWGCQFPAAGAGTFHPTQIYESISAVIIFAILQLTRRWRRNYGEVFLGCMALYGFFRFFIEFYRAENPVVLAGLKLSQILGLLAILAAVTIRKVIDRGRRHRILPATDVINLPKGS